LFRLNRSKELEKSEQSERITRLDMRHVVKILQ